MNGDKLSFKLNWIHVAEITGNGEFPLDMLRYDRCCPLEERDSAEIGLSCNPMVRGSGEPFKVRVMKYSDVKSSDVSVWSLNRWESFHCEVRPVALHQPREE